MLLLEISIFYGVDSGRVLIPVLKEAEDVAINVLQLQFQAQLLPGSVRVVKIFDPDSRNKATLGSNLYNSLK